MLECTGSSKINLIQVNYFITECADGGADVHL